jgi:hypothetical protein
MPEVWAHTQKNGVHPALCVAWAGMVRLRVPARLTALTALEAMYQTTKRVLRHFLVTAGRKGVFPRAHQNQMNPLHTIIRCFLRIHFNNIPSTSRSSSTFFYSGLSTKILYAFLIFTKCGKVPPVSPFFILPFYLLTMCKFLTSFNINWVCLRTKCWTEYLEVRKWMQCFVICKFIWYFQAD